MFIRSQDLSSATSLSLEDIHDLGVTAELIEKIRDCGHLEVGLLEEVDENFDPLEHFKALARRLREEEVPDCGAPPSAGEGTPKV